MRSFGVGGVGKEIQKKERELKLKLKLEIANAERQDRTSKERAPLRPAEIRSTGCRAFYRGMRLIILN